MIKTVVRMRDPTTPMKILKKIKIKLFNRMETRIITLNVRKSNRNYIILYYIILYYFNKKNNKTN